MNHSTNVLAILLVTIFLPALAIAQNRSLDSDSLLGADDPRAQVLLLGIFHFKDAGLDDFEPQVDADIMSPQRQDELERLLQSLEDFRPTKIAVEWSASRQGALDSAYTAYLEGDRELNANEIHQVGFRLAGRLGQERIWGIDADARWYDQGTSTEMLIQRAQSLGQRELVGRATEWIERYQAYHADVDTMKAEMSLSEYLLYLNSPEHLQRSHGQYLVGQMEVGGDGDYIGADVRTAWYNRNIRIFSNIQRSVTESGERVLVIIGAGHAPILRHLVQGSPEFRLVEPAAYLDRQ